uniref:BHLH domain-containing protein n=1 Tax=Caenorhabditis tropicalis TaxID=1561998 RepID=A0A1I7URL0_9PELO
MRDKKRHTDINDMFDTLKSLLPGVPLSRKKEMTKLQSLLLAIEYIKYLENNLREDSKVPSVSEFKKIAFMILCMRSNHEQIKLEMELEKPRNQNRNLLKTNRKMKMFLSVSISKTRNLVMK